MAGTRVRLSQTVKGQEGDDHSVMCLRQAHRSIDRQPGVVVDEVVRRPRS